VGNDNLDVADRPTRKPEQPIVQRLADDRRNPNAGRPICGAMSEQNGDAGRGDYSAPQKFIRLVGCGDSKSRLESGPETGRELGVTE
jgi:hypothetical protein